MGAGPGNFAVAYINGIEVEGDLSGLTIAHVFAQKAIPIQNTGIEQFTPGKFSPTITMKGWRKRNAGVVSVHDLLSPNTVIGNGNDTDFIITLLLGQDASPVVGDPAYGLTAGLMSYQTSPGGDDPLDFTASFRGRGKRTPLRSNVIYNGTPAAAGTFSSAVFDRGAAAASGTTKGLVAYLQCFAGTGTAATGTITFNGNPADADTVTINSVVYRFKTSPAQANDIQIGASAAATQANLLYCLLGSISQSGTAFFAGSTALASTIRVTSASNVLTLTAATKGTAGNAYTLAKSSTNLAVSGAGTLTGGAAGDSFTVTVQTATTSGGSYTTRGTFTMTCQTETAERIEVALGTTTDEFVKFVFTTVGSTNKPGVCAIVGDFYQS